MRALILSLLAVLVGAGMVAGGVWGVIDSVSGDSGSSSAIDTPELATSSPSDCSAVAERDPRFRLPHDLQFGGEGTATVQCKGPSVTFAIQIDGLKEHTFYKVVLEKGRRELDIGTILPVGADTVSTVTVGPEVRLKKYDFLTVRIDPFYTPGADDVPFRAAL